MLELDSVKINFDSGGLLVLNVALAVVMFGVALGITFNDFKNLFKQPKLVILGIVSQFVLLPFITFLVILVVKPQPSIALGMMMVAACPGGNISNFITHLAGGNSALSVCLTGIATLLAVIMTPLSLKFWGSLYEPTSKILEAVAISPIEMIKLVSLLLGVPLHAQQLLHCVGQTHPHRYRNRGLKRDCWLHASQRTIAYR